MKKITLIASAFSFAICFTLPVASLAQDGSLDLSFDTDGKVTTPIGALGDMATSVAIQSDGKIVVAGHSGNGSNYDFALTRYNTDGSLDNTFDTDGMVTTAIGTYHDYITSVAIQSDGKIVVAGRSYNNANDYDFTLVRYNTNGSLDNTFDADGIVTTAIGTSDDDAYSLAIQSDGKIVIAGRSDNGNDYDFALVRYNSNGSLDNTFDADGMVTTAIGTDNDEAFSLALQSDGKIVVAGRSYNGNKDDVALVRYNTNGSLDNTFDADGMVTTSFIGSTADGANSVAIQSDGKIVVAGDSYNGTQDKFALVRYNTNGSLDNTFDADGMVTTAIGTSYDDAKSLAIQSDGKIVVAGYSTNGTNNYVFALTRYNTNGSLDVSFDTDGMVTTSIGTSDDEPYSLAIQSDGKIVVVGYTSVSQGNRDFAVVRYNNSISVGINTIANQTTEIKIYPNPLSSSTTLQTNYLLKNATLTVYNLYGQKVKQINNLSGQTIILQRDNLSSGLYFIHLTEDNKILTTDELIITD